MAYRIVVVGTSWGGLSALRELVTGLPADLRVPVVLVQHRHRQSDHSMLSALLQERTSLNVCEVEDKAPIEAGKVYVAPADYHLLLDDDHFDLSTDEPVRYSRPSIDVTFYSAADAYGPATVGVVLTGANSDGSRGLRRIYDRGGLTLVQEPVTAESPAMPAAALRCVPAAQVLTIAQIVEVLGTLEVDVPPAAPVLRAAREPARESALPRTP
ncbi:MAG TPA: chemotaxis protein CheB, partial [Gemmatimonadaceae bacterium]|nr:chemotaxis protein CheB [Gemmatimonadaceae bacterium]